MHFAKPKECAFDMFLMSSLGALNLGNLCNLLIKSSLYTIRVVTTSPSVANPQLSLLVLHKIHC